MDFASLMSAQITKSKPAVSLPAKGYHKRGDVEAKRIAEYEAEQKRLEEERVARANKKRKLESEAADRSRIKDEKRKKLAEDSKKIKEETDRADEERRRKRLGLPPLPARGDNDGGTENSISASDDIDDLELRAKLRDLDQPATLFDESHIARLKRYEAIIDKALTPVLSKGPIPTTLKLVEEVDMKIPESVPIDAAGKDYLLRQLASYFTMVFTEWSRALAHREQDLKNSVSGKAAYNAMVLARDNMVPLFRKFEKGNVEKSILGPIIEIVRCCQARRYVDANDAYLRLSIGKAAWPIGVTMVGIHERSAREKLHETDNAAHIMSDETTRKFLQSIKRCLSFAQTRWPPDDQLQLMG